MIFFRSAIALGATITIAAIAACGPDKQEGPTLVGEDLQDPQKCLPCHAEHFKEWSGSMHT